MRPSARVRANRQNAKASTGPRSAEGKALSAKKALRHGLNVPVAMDPALADEVERLAVSIAGQGAGALQMQAATRIAEAQVDVMRIRRLRLALLSDPAARHRLLNWQEVQRAINALKRWPDPEEAFDMMEGLIETRWPKGPMRRLEEGLDALALQLAKLDRYERRTWSRRNAAIREFDGLMVDLRQETAPAGDAPSGKGAVRRAVVEQAGSSGQGAPPKRGQQ